MTKINKVLKDVAKLYDGKVSGNVVKFDSEDTLFKAADEIADQVAYTMDQDKLTIEFIDENLDINFIGTVCTNINESYDKEVVGKVLKSFGYVNESLVDSVTDQLKRLTGKKNVTVEPDIAQNIAATVTIDTVNSSTIGADGTITLQVGDKLMNVNPVTVVNLNESTFAYFGTTQLNESEYNAVIALNECDSRKRFLASMGMNDLDAESVAKNLELLKKTNPDMDDNGLLPIPGAVNESDEQIIDKFQSHNFAYEMMVQAGKLSNLKATMNVENDDDDIFGRKFSDIPGDLQKQVSNWLKNEGFICESNDYVNESKNIDIYNLQSKIALAIHKSGLKGADVLAALMLVTSEAKEGKNNFKTYINISDNKYINESDEVPLTTVDEIADKVFLDIHVDKGFEGPYSISRNTVKKAIQNLVGTVNLSERWLDGQNIINIIDKVQSTALNESINSIEHKISNEKERIQKVKAQGKAHANINAAKLADAKRSLSYSKSELKAAKKSKAINESEMINESAMAYIVPSSAYNNPWLTHYIGTNPALVGQQFGNMYHDNAVNASVLVDCDDCDDCESPKYESRSVYQYEGNLHYGSPVSSEIAPNGIINSIERFKLYAGEVLNNMGLSKLDTSAQIDKILEMNKNNYAAMMYALHRPIK